MSAFDDAWKEIMEGSQFSETVSVTLVTGQQFNIFGIFYSGSYTEESPAPYANVKWERQDWLQISVQSLPDFVENPAKDLRNAQVVIGDRGTFRVADIKGALSGMLTMRVQGKELLR